jgi:hypothetical protein
VTIGQFTSFGFQNPRRIIANQVIIFGPDSGWFVYDGTPALGNPPTAYAVSAGVATDPYGNSLPESGTAVALSGSSWAALDDDGLRINVSGIEALIQLLSSGQLNFDVNGPLAILNSSGPSQLILSGGPTPALTDDGGNVVVQAGDGNTYDTETIRLRTTGNQTIDSTTPDLIAGLSIPVSANVTYRIKGQLIGQQLTAAVADDWVLSGPTTSGGTIELTFTETDTSGVTVNTSPLGLMGTYPSPPFGVGVTYTVKLDGTVTFSADGTFEIQGAESTSGDTWQCIANSVIDLSPISGTVGSGPASSFVTPIYIPPPSGDTSGVTDDDRILPILAAMSPGQKLQVNASGYYTAVGWVLQSGCIYQGPSVTRPGKPRDAATTPTPPTLIAAAAMDAVMAEANYLGSASDPPISNSILINGFVVDGAKLATVGIAMITAASSIENCGVENTQGDGILYTDTNVAGKSSTITNGNLNRILNSYAYLYDQAATGASGIHIQSVNGKINTDGDMIGCIVDNDFTGSQNGYAILNELAADWHMEDNHIYAVLGTGFRCERCAHLRFISNCIDNPGQAGVSGDLYYGYYFTISPFGRSTIAMNRIDWTEDDSLVPSGGNGTNTYYYVEVTGGGDPDEISFFDNSCIQVKPGSVASTGYAFDGASTGLNVRGGDTTFTVQHSPDNTSPNLSATPVLTGTVTMSTI